MKTRGAVKLESIAGAASPRAEGEIAAAFARGDHRTAIGLCVTHHGEAIGRLCMALLGSQADAEAAVEETLVAAPQELAGRPASGSVRARLLALARRTCARELERRGRPPAQLRLVTGFGPSAAGALPPRHGERAERARALLGAVRPTDREALVMRYGAGLSPAELGAVFSIDEAAARARVSRGIAALRERLQQERREP